MTVQKRPPGEELPVASPTPPGRGRWSWLAIARIAWIALALVLLVIFVANIPSFSQSLRPICSLPDPSSCPTWQLTPVYVQVFDHLHLPVAVAAGFFAVLTVAEAVLYWMVGLLIFWRKSQEWMGLIVSLWLVFFGVSFIQNSQTTPLLQLLNNIAGDMFVSALIIFVFTFPTGHFTPRWTWIAFVIGFVAGVLGSIPLTATLVPPGVSILMLLLGVGVQVYRYVRVYDAVQRQQTKWVIFGLSIIFSLILTEGILGAVASSLNAAEPWYQLLNGPFWLLYWAILLLSIGIAILRYQLWDIDVLINRTLVYSLLTGTLAVLYFGFVLGLQFLFNRVAGISIANSPLILVGSTLAIAALFQPLRRGIQNIIDRRFYRRKYDARRIIANFSASLRGEVELTELSEQLVAVVEETMQPAHVSLWLAQPRKASYDVEKLSDSPVS